MKKHILAFAALAISFAVSAQTNVEVLKITLSDGTETLQTVADIKEMTFDEVPVAQIYAGVYTGTQSVVVGGQFTYTTELTYTLTAEADGTLTVSIPEYSLKNTMMGDLTLGALTIKGVTYNEATETFTLDYSSEGLKQHFTAVNGTQTVFDNDYVLGTGSVITLQLKDGKLQVTNPFKLGAMPLPLTASFSGTK